MDSTLSHRLAQLTDAQIEHWAKEWKKALGMNPYRLNADKDFQAGAHAVIMFLKDDNYHGKETKGD